ncbi:MAG: hypothetical protein LBT89_09615, partial [Planctomycetaceae bacterium]|nr:hypothetical protein [Planctomycetaceae bacterium]
MVGVNGSTINSYYKDIRNATQRIQRRGRRGTVKKLTGDADFLFWHKLALSIGGCTVAELQSRMSAREAASWRYFFYIHGPGGHERFDLNFAMLMHCITLSAGGERNDGEAFTIGDFLPKFDRKKPQSEETETEDAELSAAEVENIAGFVGKFKR